jgi:hypothetical protein
MLYSPRWPIAANGPSTPRPLEGWCKFDRENAVLQPYAIIATVDFGETVVELRAEFGSEFADPAPLEAVLEALQPAR